ncbi:MAG: hypothetical protein H6938_10215 [Burkholderiales bacterium]|nr:hypothetical protein [Burkholderiales bacterium]
MCVLPIRGDYGGMFYGRFASNRVICGKKNRVPLRGADSEQPISASTFSATAYR